jgi:hypothetical protein
LSKPTRKKKPVILFKQVYYKNDINPEYNFETNRTEIKLSELFFKIQNITPQEFNVSHNFGEVNVLKDILSGTQDNHEIILEISKKYSPSKLIASRLKLPTQDRQSKILCLIPLVRSQVEIIYTIILLLLKQNKMFKKFIKSSWAIYYQIEIYKIEESKKLKRSNYKEIHQQLQKLIVGKQYQQRFKKILTKKDLIQIENQLKKGNIDSIGQFPTPLKAIHELTIGKNNFPPPYRSSLLKVLKKIYIQYRSLCLYMHGSEMQNFAGRSLRTGEIDLVKK